MRDYNVMFTFISMKFGCVLHVSMCLHSMKFAGTWGVCYVHVRLPAVCWGLGCVLRTC